MENNPENTNQSSARENSPLHATPANAVTNFLIDSSEK